MRKLEELKDVVSKERYIAIEEILMLCVNVNYDYLGISLASWEDLIVELTSKIVLKKTSNCELIGELYKDIHNAVSNYIKRDIKKGSIRVCNNLLIKLYRNYKRELVLKYFVYELEYLGISFIDQVYDLMKNNSTYFNSLLSFLGILNYSKEELVDYLNKKFQLKLRTEFKRGKTVDNEFIDYAKISEEYSNMTFGEIKELLGADFNNLPTNSVNLLERYFASPIINKWLFPYNALKAINLIKYNFKRKNITLDINTLKKVYLENKEEFSIDQRLYLECFVFGLQSKENMPKGKKISKCDLIAKLEKLYYGINNLFDYTLTKEQYLEVLERYPKEADKFRKDVLDDYYGIETKVLSISELGKKYGMSDDEMRELIKKSRKYCLSLYSNLNYSQKISKDIYMPYVLDEKYELNSETREALTLFFEGFSYDEISQRIKKTSVSTIISKGIQKIDGYRFDVLKSKVEIKDMDIDLTNDDIIEEINRHPSESVISNEEKTFLSYFLGIKNSYNLNGDILKGKALQEKLGFKRNVLARYRDITNKLKQRKLGVLEPEFIVIPRDELSEILENPHLPISLEDRKIICSLLEINGYPFMTVSMLAQVLGVTDKSIKRKYQIAIINIKKYLIGEKEGVINYEFDIVPNLKYFTLKERELINDYYVNNLTNKEIAKKYNLSIGRVTRLMYRIKTTLNELINNPNAKKFDYDYYKRIVNEPNFPFRGDLELAKRIFDLYVGDSNFGRADTQEIKQILGLDMHPLTIYRIIDRLVLAVFKYQDGIRKENSFSLEEVKDFYRLNKSSFTKEEIQLFDVFFNKDWGVDLKMSEDLTFLLLKSKYPDYYKIDSSREVTFKLLKKYYSKLSKITKTTIMYYAGLTERDFMSGQDKNRVFRILANLDRKLADEKNQKRVLNFN